MIKKKFLILRFSSIGDIVLTTPIVRCLKNKFPNAEIHFATKAAFAGILTSNPNISKVHLLDKSGIWDLVKRLKSENFDEVLDLHNNLRTRIIKLCLLKPSYTFDKLNLRKWLLVKFKINTLPDIHIVDRYFETIKHLGAVNDLKGLDYYIPEKDNLDLSFLPDNFQAGFDAFVIGGQHQTKQLPLEKIIEFCLQINKPIVLIGGKEDAENGERISKTLGKQIFNACGKINLNQSASIVAKAQKVYTHDTGMMHVAAALKKEIVVFWGNTVPEFGMYPYLTSYQNIEVKGLSCRPCSKIGFNGCPKGHFDCMKLQQIELENLA